MRPVPKRYHARVTGADRGLAELHLGEAAGEHRECGRPGVRRPSRPRIAILFPSRTVLAGAAQETTKKVESMLDAALATDD